MSRMCELDSPLGDALAFSRMSVSEGLSRLFEIRLEAVSGRGDIRADELLGRPVSIRVAIGGGRHRYFSGYCTEFSLGEPRGRQHGYHLILRPWLWFLTLTANCRVHQGKSVPEILEAVFAGHPTRKVEERLLNRSRYAPWEYSVQYRETDFNFVSRLMEQEGIYYAFEHSPSGHTLVLFDHRSMHRPFERSARLPFVPPEQARATDREHVFAWGAQHQVLSGKVSLDEYKETRPGEDLAVTKVAEPRPEHPHADHEVFDYPGEYDSPAEGLAYATHRIEEIHANASVHVAAAKSRSIQVGRTFRLTGHPRRDLNAEYMVVSADHTFSDEQHESGLAGGAAFDCRLEAIPATRPYRAPRRTPRPTVQGVLTGVVCGPAGEEIHTDHYGRIKVQFFWDRYGRRDDGSSCWIRVASPWANSGFGFIAVPRIGSEVVVTFVDGDPDRPIVTGAVYNDDNLPPYPVGSRPAVAGLRTHSSKGGATDAFNEVRLDDTAGAELFFTQAQKDQHSLVKNDRIAHVRKDDHLGVDGAMFVKVGRTLHEKVEADRLSEAGGSMHTKVGQDLMVKAGQRLGADAGQEIHLKAGMKLVLEAGMSITLKVGGNFVSITPAGIDIQGTLVKVNSGGAAGAGSGVSVRAPQAARTAPAAEAVASRPPRPPKAQPTNRAATLKAAARNHAPLCEKCEGC